MVEQLCIGGLLYDESAHSCNWPESVEGCQKHRKFRYNFLFTYNIEIGLMHFYIFEKYLLKI